MMWDCGFPLSSLWIGGNVLWGLGAILLMTVLLGIFLLGARKTDKTHRADRDDSLEIIKARLARGEINQEDYLEIKKVLEQA
ncbi:SHOCT domain-containing protein [Desulfovibrio sp. TomC]|uniref:SHOCT domain-containing protein n=1 Tax=Desulfovibrio sp. TomC TaxID=1562888 RepID=UPI0005B9128B|nr:SHOCT domain-containing protein [Desulfovibrio sp. TomC]